MPASSRSPETAAAAGAHPPPAEAVGGAAKELEENLLERCLPYFLEFIRKLKNRFCGTVVTGSARKVSGAGAAKARVVSKISLRPLSKSVGVR